MGLLSAKNGYGRWMGWLDCVMGPHQHAPNPGGDSFKLRRDGIESYLSRWLSKRGQEAELHYHSLEPMASQNRQLAIAEELKQKYGQGKITEEICPKCGRKFQCYSQGVSESGGALQYYSDDSVFCNSCLMDEF